SGPSSPTVERSVPPGKAASLPGHDLGMMKPASCRLGMLRPSLSPFIPQKLPQSQPQKPRVMLEIPSPKTARFHNQTEQPFQSSPLHPLRRLFYPPRMKIKGGAHRHHHSLHTTTMLRHPTFLFRT